MMPGRCAVVILAAGLSSRMGSPKPLLPLGHRTLLEQTVTSFRNAGIKDIKVVLGHQHQKLTPLLKHRHVAPVVNSNYRKGMFSSVTAGISVLAPATEAVFVHPVDIPLLRPRTITHLLDVHHTLPEKILRPCFREKRGHPPLIPRRFFPHILSWNGQGGLKTVLARFEADALTVEVSDPGILFDIDTPDDYKAALAKWQHQNPEPGETA